MVSVSTGLLWFIMASCYLSVLVLLGSNGLHQRSHDLSGCSQHGGAGIHDGLAALPTPPCLLTVDLEPGDVQGLVLNRQTLTAALDIFHPSFSSLLVVLMSVYG